MSQPSGSLSRLRVVDLWRVLGGPYCSQILGEDGAGVLKMEPPEGMKRAVGDCPLWMASPRIIAESIATSAASR
ncbi:hypothetical protein HCN50_32440 [Bradyrhizobium sp. WSM 1744]|uniref:CoA transferase n=1 Tax=Bradyrhizobium archetypum TaxID=2721160 RepID=A0A7Y4HAW8_9BRAD|nr:hypothetical protein [Bradyrhizobium archetypum]